MALSGHAMILHPLQSKSMTHRHRLPLFPVLEMCRTEMKGHLPQAFTGKGIKKNKPLHLVVSRAAIGSSGGSDSSLQIIKELYSSINKKDLKSLGALLSQDCFVDDFSFPQPFEGKKEALCFFEELITSMGQNTEFVIEHICGGVDQTAVVNWHLEWKKKQVPFTRGCSCYELSKEGEQLVIKKAQVIIESPVKPGGLALTVFKGINLIFDAFPGATERFLNSPYAIFQILLNIYKIVLGPMIRPVVSWYLRLMRLTAAFLSLTFKVVQLAVKNFNK
ncbi:unnamed protein product [Cuscuta epithymum]|uniref:SnoaL-like domain-containing protein n=1 Tax=Cuscuta epithymum TaxID=186058 RepID=A0AAV0EKU0_9ASTE|nr:unnamed protein product [Cuscuta epithymum]